MQIFAALVSSAGKEKHDQANERPIVVGFSLGSL